MVKREIETTVAVEKEREVTETYFDEETVTEEYAICNACGEFSEERGGNHEIPLEMPTPKAPLPMLEDHLIDGITHAGMTIESPSIEFEVYPKPEMDMHGSVPQIPVGNVGTERLAVHDDEVTIFRGDELEQRIRRAVRDAMSSVEYTDVPTVDICDECLTYMESNDETLDTAAYESVETDEGDGGEGFEPPQLVRYALYVAAFAALTTHASVVLGSLLWIVSGLLSMVALYTGLTGPTDGKEYWPE